MAVWRRGLVFFQQKCAFFGIRPFGRRVPGGALDDHQFLVIEGWGGGDAWSLTPMCSATCTISVSPTLQLTVGVIIHIALHAHFRNNSKNNNHNKAQPGLCCFFLVTKWSSPVVDMTLHGDHGATWQRRQRRQRSWWRHEQLSVAMALSAAIHQSFDKVAAEAKYSGLRAQKTDRAEAAPNAPRRPTTSAARGPEIFQLYEEKPGGGRPEGAVAHSDTARGVRANGADPRCSCAAYGGPVGGRREDHRHSATCCCWAGDRSAQDQSPGQNAPCSAGRRWRNSWWKYRFLCCPAFSMLLCRRWGQNWWKCRTSCLSSSLSSRPLTFQFRLL